MRVLRIDEKLAAVPMPPLELVERLPLRSGDCLVLSAGFEDRVLAVLDSALAGSERFHVIIIEYLPFVSENRSALIREKCVRHGLSFSAITYDRQNPAGFGEVLLSRLNDCDRSE